MYKPVNPNVSFPKQEEEILRFWEKHKIFERSLQEREGAEEFVFYDGPPFATGLPHYGHFVPSTIKDLILRYQTMKGKRAERRFGWDCHGLPVEYEMEKELGISGKKQIEAYGVAKFNEKCRSIVLRYVAQWREMITRLGRWVDFDNGYKTMDLSYMETIWWVVKQLWDRDLVYKGHHILPYCPRCSTALSNHELVLGGYEQVDDPAITVRFKIKGEDQSYFLAWTTTPWTLLSNMALALGADIPYVKVKDDGVFYILSEESLVRYYPEGSYPEVVQRYKGRELVGLTYEALFPHFREEGERGAFRIVLGEHVVMGEGTGIVHTAPGFGEDDFLMAKAFSLPIVVPLDDECCFLSPVEEYAGQFVKSCDQRIIAHLKEKGALVRYERYLHAYPHCWRCKGPLIYRAIDSWFVAVERIRERLVAVNARVNWVPAHLKEGRFGKWLEGARDWVISRNRYWGNPLPIWTCNSCEEQVCMGSLSELEKRTGEQIQDLHKHYVDALTFPCPSCGGTMSRIKDVLDCWFESGAMPYAQRHYPFEEKGDFSSCFPADFITEGLDQTRGWFYTLIVLSTALFDEPAFHNVVVNGLVLAEDGKKMSKSTRNYTDPGEMITRFGADAMRLYLMNSAAVRAENLRFSEAEVKRSLRGVIIPLWNAYSFFVTYANLDGLTPQGRTEGVKHPLDRWILSEGEALAEAVAAKLDEYDLQKAIAPIVRYVDLLNNWYIRRSRRRFWRGENDTDKVEAHETLYAVLMRLIAVASPVIPFVTEAIYQNLRREEMADSIHLTSFPTPNKAMRDKDLEERMNVVREVVSMGRALRNSHMVKIRQPLQAIHIVAPDPSQKDALSEMSEVIAEELNVKKVFLKEQESEFVTYAAKANFKVLGKVLGRAMKEAALAIEALSQEKIKRILDGRTVRLSLSGGQEIALGKDEVSIKRASKASLRILNQGTLTIALDTEITKDLYQEGLARDLIRGVQNLRRERGLDVADRIRLTFAGSSEVREVVDKFRSHIFQEVLGEEYTWNEERNGVKISCGETVCWIELDKV